MPTNVEIKARVADPAALERALLALRPRGPEILVQEDVFFACPDGRLKLRMLRDGRAELIHYEREAAAGPRPSRYTVAPTSAPAALRSILAATLGELGVVRKVRRLFLVGQTRVHLDSVEGLGDFLELEVVLRDGQSADAGASIARDLMRCLGVVPESLVRDAYFDLLRADAGAAGGRGR